MDILVASWVFRVEEISKFLRGLDFQLGAKLPDKISQKFQQERYLEDHPQRM